MVDYLTGGIRRNQALGKGIKHLFDKSIIRAYILENAGFFASKTFRPNRNPKADPLSFNAGDNAVCNPSVYYALDCQSLMYQFNTPQINFPDTLVRIFTKTSVSAVNIIIRENCAN